MRHGFPSCGEPRWKGTRGADGGCNESANKPRRGCVAGGATAHLANGRPAVARCARRPALTASSRRTAQLRSRTAFATPTPARRYYSRRRAGAVGAVWRHAGAGPNLVKRKVRTATSVSAAPVGPLPTSAARTNPPACAPPLPPRSAPKASPSSPPPPPPLAPAGGRRPSACGLCVSERRAHMSSRATAWHS
jgi:hypothetical protein